MRAYGIFDFKVVDPKLFLKEVAGTDDHFRFDEFATPCAARGERVLGGAGPVEDSGARRRRALWRAGRGAAAADQSADIWKYGIEVQSFIVENVSVLAEVEQAIDKRSSMAAVGNPNDYAPAGAGSARKAGRAEAGSPASAPKWRSAWRWRSR
jgi:membrane protease subunit (stomatin/prohibitin family)